MAQCGYGTSCIQSVPQAHVQADGADPHSRQADDFDEAGSPCGVQEPRQAHGAAGRQGDAARSGALMEKPLHGRVQDGRGKHKITGVDDPNKQAFLDWLCTPPKEREPRNQQALADKLGVAMRTLTTWRNNDKEFIEEWERRYLTTIGSPSRKQSIMDTLYRTATDADDPKHVQAAKTYFEIEGSMKPTKMTVEVSRPASELSDEELQAIMQSKAADELKQRREAS